MYPAGHPSQEQSASGVLQRLTGLLAERPVVSIGIAREQVIIDGIASDAKHPILRGLAEKFHRQHIGALTFQRGVDTSEIAAMMQLVATEPEKGERPVGLGSPDLLRQWPNVRLHPLTYDSLRLAGEAAPLGDDEAQGEHASRSAQLWIGLARAALNPDAGTEVSENVEPADVAQAINRQLEAPSQDQAIVGYLLQIAQELKGDSGAASEAVKERIGRLIGGLSEDSLQRLVTMNGDVQQRSRFVLDSADTLPVDAVVEIARAAAESTGQTISTSLMRMLSKLSVFAEEGPARLQAQADHALREQVRDLVKDWSLADPNPEAYTTALQTMAAPRSTDAGQAEAQEPEPLRLVQMGIEVEMVGPAFWRALEALERDGGLFELISTLQTAPRDNVVVRQLWPLVATEENARKLLLRGDVDSRAVSALLDHLAPEAAIAMLLDTLTGSESRDIRMSVFRHIVAMGPSVAQHLVARLASPEWYVKRNVLAILNELNIVPEGFSPAELARHADPRVRREAFTLWFRMPGEYDRALSGALRDTDDRIVRAGISAAAQHGVSDALAPVIAARLHERDLAPDLRVQLVRIIGQLDHPLAIDTLLRIVVVGKTLFRAPKLAPASPLVLMALTTLAARWPANVRVKPVLKRALKSRDPEVRSALEKAGLGK